MFVTEKKKYHICGQFPWWLLSNCNIYDITSHMFQTLILMHLQMQRDVWLDNVINLQQYILRYTAWNPTSLRNVAFHWLTREYMQVVLCSWRRWRYRRKKFLFQCFFWRENVIDFELKKVLLPPPREFCRHILSWRKFQAASFKRCLHSVLRGYHVLRLRLRVAVKLNFRPYIRRYTSPNENFEYSYPLIIQSKTTHLTTLRRISWKAFLAERQKFLPCIAIWKDEQLFKHGGSMTQNVSFLKT